MAALVRLLEPLDVAAPAVRTAVSRMVRQGWLRPVRLPQGAGYGLTPKAVSRLDEAARRIYRPGDPAWDGHWHMIVFSPVRDRSRRDRLRATLAFLGFAPLSETTWIGPRSPAELDLLLDGENVHADRFDAALRGDPRELVARAWDLAAIGEAYERWHAEAVTLISALPVQAPPGQVFATRSKLVHGWRNFLFRDPGLPPELLPAGWPGEKARIFFEQEAARLLPAAAAFVDRELP